MGFKFDSSLVTLKETVTSMLYVFQYRNSLRCDYLLLFKLFSDICGKKISQVLMVTLSNLSIVLGCIHIRIQPFAFTVAHYHYSSRGTLCKWRWKAVNDQMRARSSGAQLVTAQQQMQLMCRIHV